MALNYAQLKAAFQTGNVPGVDNVDGFRTDGGEDRRYRNWNGLCEAAAAWIARFTGGFVNNSNGTAWEAWLNSPTHGTDLYSAPVGAFLYWRIGSDGHVAFKVTQDGNGGSMLHGYSDLDTDVWGTNIGVVSVANFQARHGWEFVGWSWNNGPSTASFTDVVPPPPVPAGALLKQSRYAGDSAVFRTEPNRNGAFSWQTGADGYAIVDGWTENEEIHQDEVKTKIWFKRYGANDWSSGVNFTSLDTTGLTFIKTLADPILEPEPEPEPTPDPEPEPTPDPEPEPEPNLPEPPPVKHEYRPINQEDIMAIQNLPQVTVEDGALDRVIEDPDTRKKVYSFWTIFGMVLQAVGAGMVAGATAAVATVAIGWALPLVVGLAIFAGISAAYMSLTPQVTQLARANVTPPVVVQVPGQ